MTNLDVFAMAGVGMGGVLYDPEAGACFRRPSKRSTRSA
jgi:hypothetical protein